MKNVTLIFSNQTKKIKPLKNRNIMKTIVKTALVVCIAFFAQSASAQNMDSKEKTVTVGGAAMYPSKNIIENAMNSKDHTTLVAAVKAAGLVETLQGAGPFTVFAPTNEAFNKLPKGTVETLLKPENKAMLSGILTYHVVSGKIDSKMIMDMIKKGNGKAEMKTVNGGMLTFTMSGNKIMIKDEKGGMSSITIKDVYQSNGVIHVVDTVLMPK